MSGVRRFGFSGRGRIVAVDRSAIVWQGLGGWTDAMVDLAGRARASATHFDLALRLYRSLAVDDVRRCHDADALARAAALFDAYRRAWSRPLLMPAYPGDRAVWGALFMEARNRRAALASERAGVPRARGPRFDPARIPDDRLAILLQRAGDPARRAALQAETARRAAATVRF